MKKIITTVLVCCLFLACKNKEEAKIPAEITAQEAIDKKEVESSKMFQHLTSEMLVPLELLDEESNEVTSKYGLEFGGVCHACDVANIIMDNELLTLLNACDEGKRMSFKIVDLKLDGKQLTVITSFNEFTFLPIEESPLVYKLTVFGDNIDETYFREAFYYTLRSQLPSFEVNDCGEFEG